MRNTIAPLIYTYFDGVEVHYSTHQPEGRDRYIGYHLPEGDMTHYMERSASQFPMAQLFELLTYKLTIAEASDIIRTLPSNIRRMYKSWLEGAVRMEPVGYYQARKPHNPSRTPKYKRKTADAKYIKPLPMERDGMNREDMQHTDYPDDRED